MTKRDNVGGSNGGLRAVVGFREGVRRGSVCKVVIGLLALMAHLPINCAM